MNVPTSLTIAAAVFILLSRRCLHTFSYELTVILSLTSVLEPTTRGELHIRPASFRDQVELRPMPFVLQARWMLKERNRRPF